MSNVKLCKLEAPVRVGLSHRSVSLHGHEQGSAHTRSESPCHRGWRPNPAAARPPPPTAARPPATARPRSCAGAGSREMRTYIPRACRVNNNISPAAFHIQACTDHVCTAMMRTVAALKFARSTPLLGGAVVEVFVGALQEAEPVVGLRPLRPSRRFLRLIPILQS
jgi:hypothetical protein